MTTFKIHNGNCFDILKTLPDNSIDSIVTDPPYGLSKEPDMNDVLAAWMNGLEYKHGHAGFMGKEWDSFVPGPNIWKECLRVLKPGGHMVAFFGTRTYDLGVLAIRMAGFEIRDQLAWVYGSGFPKSLNISKAIDKSLGAEREVIGTYNARGFSEVSPTNDGRNQWSSGEVIDKTTPITAPATDAAKQWEGWGTALKPAQEPIVLARKPLSENTVAENTIKYGTGGINIDDCRIPTNPDIDDPRLGGNRTFKTDKAAKNVYEEGYTGEEIGTSTLGRWPANIIHDGSDEVLELFPESGSGNNRKPYSYTGKEYNNSSTSMFNGDKPSAPSNYNDNGSAARFFYCAKTSKHDRNEGLPDSKNNHPTVKPTKLMQYLCKLITPKGGTVLDPFNGSGSTGKAAVIEGFNYIGIELDPEYVKISEARIQYALDNLDKFDKDVVGEPTLSSDEPPDDEIFSLE